jgi:RHS repeat-associated protein
LRHLASFIKVFLTYENESNNWVFFDDLKVSYTPGNIIQQNDYYPFGLAMSTSWTRETAVNNNYLYNAGSELNDNTQWYEMFFRGYDPALGRMLQIDPVASKYSSLTPYNYAFNDPVFFNDPLGDEGYSSYDYWSNYARGGGSLVVYGDRGDIMDPGGRRGNAGGLINPGFNAATWALISGAWNATPAGADGHFEYRNGQLLDWTIAGQGWYATKNELFGGGFGSWQEAASYVLYNVASAIDKKDGWSHTTTGGYEVFRNQIAQKMGVNLPQIILPEIIIDGTLWDIGHSGAQFAMGAAGMVSTAYTLQGRPMYTGSNEWKSMKNTANRFGRRLGVGSAAFAGIDMIVNGPSANNTITAAMGLITLVPGGQFVAGGYFIVDLIWTVTNDGKSIGQSLDEYLKNR